MGAIANVAEEKDVQILEDSCDTDTEVEGDTSNSFNCLFSKEKCAVFLKEVQRGRKSATSSRDACMKE